MPYPLGMRIVAAVQSLTSQSSATALAFHNNVLYQCVYIWIPKCISLDKVYVQSGKGRNYAKVNFSIGLLSLALRKNTRYCVGLLWSRMGAN